MPIEHQGQTLYTPKEAAKMLGISVGMLRYHRGAGDIEGVELGTTTLYTEEQIRNANLSQKKRGPKDKKTSVMLMAFGDQSQQYRNIA